MNFEEMQNRWQAQFLPNSGVQADSMNARLLERIIRNQRGYARTLLLMALRDVLAAGLMIAALIFMIDVGHHPSPAVVRACGRALGVWTAVLFLLHGIILRRMPGMLAIRAERSPLTLDSRLRRDARRFTMLVVWGELKQIVLSAVMVAFVVVLTDRTGVHGPTRWIAVGLAAGPAVAVLARRIFVRQRPAAEQSPAETLVAAIRETQDELRRTKRRWYPPLPLVAMILSLKPVWWTHEAMHPVGWMVLAIFTATWIFGLIVNGWVIRRLLRPRLRELKQLQAGLTPVEPSEQ